jgi:hypothetical protein
MCACQAPGMILKICSDFKSAALPRDRVDGDGLATLVAAARPAARETSAPERSPCSSPCRPATRSCLSLGRGQEHDRSRPSRGSCVPRADHSSASLLIGTTGGCTGASACFSFARHFVNAPGPTSPCCPTPLQPREDPAGSMATGPAHLYRRARRLALPSFCRHFAVIPVGGAGLSRNTKNAVARASAYS